MSDWRDSYRNEPRSPWLRALGGLVFGLLLVALYVGLLALGEAVVGSAVGR